MASIEMQDNENSAMVGQPKYTNIDMSENPGESYTSSKISL